MPSCLLSYGVSFRVGRGYHSGGSMSNVYLVKICKVESVAEVSLVADSKREAIKKVEEDVIKKNIKLPWKKPLCNPIYFGYKRNKKMER